MTSSDARARVCFVAPMMGAVGGVPNPAETIADALAEQGYHLVFTSSRAGRLSRAADMCATLVREHRRLDVAVISVFSGSAFAWCAVTSLLARGLRLPVVLVLHGGNLPSFQAAHPRLFRRILRWATLVVSPSEFLGRVADQAGVGRVVVPNPVVLPLAELRPTEAVRPSLFWMRTFAPEYDPITAVEVVHELRRRGVDATMDMAGKDYGSEQEVRDRIAQLDLAEHVRIVGFLDAAGKAEAFASHGIYLHTNLVDNTPVSVLEALAAGLPVVATTAGGLPDLLTNEETGLLVPPGDHEAMAGAICRILDDPALADRLVRGGRELAESCSVEAVAQAWDQVLRTVVPGAPSSPR